ncbi:MAG: hypothetical protein J7M29_03870 [Verrucomicrobia bacterium]|nr:hypothetical protein [Verrucomicrobiota bacterium]
MKAAERANGERDVLHTSGPLRRRWAALGALTLLVGGGMGVGVLQPILKAGEPQGKSTPWIWIEAEGTSGGETDPELSGGRMVWVGPGGELSRPVDVPQAGRYTLWVRKFWNPQAIRWRVGQSEWREAQKAALVNLVILGNNPGRRVGWFNAGAVALPAGRQTLEIQVLPGDPRTTAYDCFLLTAAPFSPRGRLRPGESSGASEPGWFAFEPPPDPFEYSPIDLRFLNHRRAGERGFLKVDGDQFVWEKTGEPARFWAVNVGMSFGNLQDQDLARFARAMAKRGVNLVRIHGRVYAGSGPNWHAAEPQVIDRLHALAAALKREGIYTALSIYFPLWVRLGPDDPTFPGYSGQHPFALPYFHEAFRPIYRRWWRAVLEPVNPHTGLPLKDDPALAMLELINEDSTLFWTFNPDRGAQGNIPDPQRALLEKQFARWLLDRYPGETLEEIRQRHWQGLATAQDDLAAGRVGFRPLWNIAQERRPRDQDTARFLTELMRRWYSEEKRFLKEELGCRALVYGSNWKTASPTCLDPLDKYANAVGDFFDRHGYYSGRHDGDRSSWDIVAGQRYDDRASVRFLDPAGKAPDFANPLWDISYNGRPSTITEINWPLPNRFRADMIPLGAAYGALQGADALFWFAASEPEWQELPGKFAIQTPVALGQFPAGALIYRQGLVQTAPEVVDLDLRVEDLFALKGTPVPAPQNFDQLRGQDAPPGATLTNVNALDELAFLVGRVRVDFLEKGAPQSRVRDFSPFIDRDQRRVRSATGELEWDWGRGLVAIQAPAAQGAIGFLGAAGRIDLPDFWIESPLEYGSILLVAMDGQPIRASSKLLLQVMSEEKPWRWQTKPGSGLRVIQNRGQPPLMIRELAGDIGLRRPDAGALSVTALDALGYRTGTPRRGAAQLSLQPRVFFYLIERIRTRSR